MEGLIIEFFASFYIYFLYIGLAVLWVIDGKIKKEQVIHAIVATLVAALVVSFIKRVFPTLRPFMVNGMPTDVVITPNDGAFPSGHTAEAFALAVTVFMHDRKVGFWFLISAFSVGAARVMANVHYPVDILGGAFIGTLIAVIVERQHFTKFIQKISTRR